MAMGKAGFYMSILFVAVLFSGLLLSVGNDLNNDPSITLDEKSKDYLGTYTVGLNTSSFQPLGEANDLDNTSILQGAEEGETSSFDIFATINYYKSRVEGVLSFFSVIGNLPAFMLVSLGLPVTPFSIFSNIFSVIFWVSLILLFIKFVRGS